MDGRKGAVHEGGLVHDKNSHGEKTKEEEDGVNAVKKVNLGLPYAPPVLD